MHIKGHSVHKYDTSLLGRRPSIRGEQSCRRSEPEVKKHPTIGARGKGTSDDRSPRYTNIIANQGITKIHSNVKRAYTEIVKLGELQGCPLPTIAEQDHMKSVLARARIDSQQQELNAAKDHSRVRKNAETLTDADISNLLRVCALEDDRQAGARAQVMILVGCATGFRACGMIHQTWFNLIRDRPNQFNTTSPQAFDMLGIGIAKHKTNTTGKVEFTGLTRHAMADMDAMAAMGDLLALEIHDGFQLLQNMRTGSTDWDSMRMLFPGYQDKSETAQVKQISSLLTRMTNQVKTM